MGQQNRRREPRVDCDVPARLLAEAHADLDVRIVDVSRTGLRVRVEGHLLGLHRLSSLASVARTVARIFGEEIEAELNHEKLGPLLRRSMKATRIAKRDWEHAYIELGCALTAPLSDEEADLIGIVLPPSVAAAEEAPLQLLGDETSGRFDAVVHAGVGYDASPLTVVADVITSGMAMLKVPDPANHGFAQLDVTSAIVALHEAYGPQVTVEIYDGDQQIWTGPAEITEVDVLQGARARAHIGIVFGRPLRADELTRMGLPAPA